MRRALAAILTATLAGQSVANAVEAVTLAPSSPWNIDYSDDSCALRRTFGTGEQAVILEMRQFAPGDGFRMLVASRDKSFRQTYPKFRFAAADPFEKAENPLYFDYGNKLRGVDWNHSFFPKLNDLKQPPPRRTPADQFAVESKADRLELGGIFSPPVILATGKMHGPMEAMRACLDELVTHWGIDAATQRTLSRPAWPLEQMKWAQAVQANFPTTMLGVEDGLVRVRLMVNALGRPSECHVQMKSQDPAFEKATCESLMQAARFTPALDASGKPVPSYWVTTVIYHNS